MKFSNNLSDGELERLALLGEELCEAGQIIGKILRHGYKSYHPITGLVNVDRLEEEIGHIIYAIGLMHESGDVDLDKISCEAHNKALAVGQYLHHQSEEVLNRIIELD